jgi:hypothetical protein
MAGDAQRGVLLRSDCRFSAGSAQLGPVPRDAIKGRAILRVTRHGCIAWIARRVPERTSLAARSASRS